MEGRTRSPVFAGVGNYRLPSTHWLVSGGSPKEKEKSYNMKIQKKKKQNWFITNARPPTHLPVVPEVAELKRESCG